MMLNIWIGAEGPRPTKRGCGSADARGIALGKDGLQSGDIDTVYSSASPVRWLSHVDMR